MRPMALLPFQVYQMLGKSAHSSGQDIPQTRKTYFGILRAHQLTWMTVGGRFTILGPPPLGSPRAFRNPCIGYYAPVVPSVGSG